MVCRARLASRSGNKVHPDGSSSDEDGGKENRKRGDSNTRGDWTLFFSNNYLFDCVSIEWTVNLWVISRQWNVNLKVNLNKSELLAQ